MKNIKIEKTSELGYYTIYKDGRVWSNKTNRYLKPYINKGYETINIKIDEKRKTVTIHRLIAETFIPNPENKREVDHIDGNKLNNNINNLEWVSSKENKRRAWDIGLYENTRKQSKYNIEKVNSKRRKKVYSINKTSGLITAYNSISTAAIIHKTSTSNICKVLKGKMNSCKQHYWSV